MTTLGYKLSSEEFGPRELVRFARIAEESGFQFALISDHFHPWTDAQGQSPFVWSVIGGVAEATSRLVVGTGVTCPTIRTHPAIIAQAAATSAVMLPGRFFLGVGTGENLNEHIVGARWPAVDVRRAMLAEAIDVIRALWRGGYQDHYGRYYTVERARLYTRPETPPPIVIAASGPKSAELAGRLGDGLVATEPDRELIKAFGAAGGGGKPRYGEISVCWARDEASARRTAHRTWPLAGFHGPLVTELASPAHFEGAARMVTEDAIAEAVVCGPDPQRYLARIREYAAAGFDHLCVHQIGPDQEGFLRFYAREILPALSERRAAA
jgi:coenzyme F420-dependent glucose-6-phosphate dehydrogenase